MLPQGELLQHHFYSSLAVLLATLWVLRGGVIPETVGCEWS